MAFPPFMTLEIHVNYSSFYHVTVPWLFFFLQLLVSFLSAAFLLPFLLDLDNGFLIVPLS